MNGDLPVEQELAERLPLIAQIDQPFAQQRVLRDERQLLLDPSKERFDERRGLVLSEREALVRAAQGGRFLDAKQGLDGLEREGRLFVLSSPEHLDETLSRARARRGTAAPA